MRWTRIGFLLVATITVFAWSPAYAQGPGDSMPPFTLPYNSPEPLEKFLVFTAPPRENVPDGQIHWVDQEVPGIDVLGPDGNIRSMCPDEGLACRCGAATHSEEAGSSPSNARAARPAGR